MEWLAATGNKEAWREHAKQILDEEKMRECTFKPQLAPSKNPDATCKIVEGPQRAKYEQLYAKAKP